MQGCRSYVKVVRESVSVDRSYAAQTVASVNNNVLFAALLLLLLVPLLLSSEVGKEGSSGDLMQHKVKLPCHLNPIYC